MSDSDAFPEPDATPGAPHPRFSRSLHGQDTAESVFLGAALSGRIHHAWLISGPRGVGKATLAWRIARYLLSEATNAQASRGASGLDRSTLEIPDDTSLARRMIALAEPRLHLLRRSAAESGGRLSQEIRVDDVRALGRFFALSAADGGRRVVIVDTIDEMNRNAANAFLKMLEEPPERAVMLLVSHQPARLLPTIRSRCRMLRLGKLAPSALAAILRNLDLGDETDPLALAELSDGSAGMLVRLAEANGLAIYSDLLKAASTGDRASFLALSDLAVSRGAGDRSEVLYLLVDTLLGRLAKTGAGHLPANEAAEGERSLLSRLAPSPEFGRLWADLQANASNRIAHGRAVNLDPAALILDTMIKIDETAGLARARA